MIEPERGIPLPPIPYGKGGPPRKYGYQNMQIGDSIFIARASPSTWLWERQTGFKFSRRAVVEGDTKGFRVWRVA